MPLKDRGTYSKYLQNDNAPSEIEKEQVVINAFAQLHPERFVPKKVAQLLALGRVYIHPPKADQ